MEPEHIPEEPSHKKGRHRKKQLYNSILQQMEFYFSDSNLSKDRFLSQLIETDPDIEISIFLKFNKLRKLTTNIEDIAKAISKSQLIQLSEDKTKVRRKLPIKFNKNVDDCTIYVERLKSDATHEWLKSIFVEFGNVVYVSIPKYKHNGMIKGFAFVEFENPEGAKAAMQYFESIDCKIPSDIEPQKLCSIATFTPNIVENEKKIKEEGGGEKNGQENVEMDEDVNKNGPKLEDIKSEGKEEVENVNKSGEEVHIEKKRKHSGSGEASCEVAKKKVKIEEGPEEIQAQKKRKHSETETTEEEPSGDKKKLKNDDVIIPETTKNLEAMSDGEAEEKKKKKHKKSNRKKINLKEIGLQILCKKDWKKMRNRYLEMQRKTMKQLKMHLNRQRFNHRYGNKKTHHEDKNSEMEVKKENETPELQSEFIPGTIVKVSLTEPCENNKKLKSEFKDLPHEVKFVDIPLKFGSEEIFVRFSDNVNAQAFVASNFNKGKTSILEGDEEKMYWKKIEVSRQDKQKKFVGKQRGRDKLLKKAEKQAGKHVRFDDNDSE